MKIKYTTPFTMVENRIIRHTELTIYQKMMFIALCSYANNDNICFPSYETIAGVVGCSRRKVIDTIKELISLGLIRKHKSENRAANEYEIVASGECDSPPNAPPAPRSSAYDSPGSASPAPELYSVNNIKSFNNNHLSISEQAELDKIIEQSEIEGLKNEKDKELFQQAITEMYQSKQITVCGNTYPQSVVRKNLLSKLNYDVIAAAHDKLRLMEIPPKSPINYLVSMIYRGFFETEIE